MKKLKVSNNNNVNLARGKCFLINVTLMSVGIFGFDNKITVSEKTGAAIVEYNLGDDFIPTEFHKSIFEKVGLHYILNNPQNTIKSIGFTVLERTSNVEYTNLYG